MPDVDRGARADYIARRLAIKVGQVVPTGAGRALDIWAAVEIPNRRFITTMVAFEKGEATEEDVIAQGQKLLRAWQRAAAEFHKEADDAD